MSTMSKLLVPEIYNITTNVLYYPVVYDSRCKLVMYLLF